MFSTFQDQMQYIFVEKNFIFTVFLDVKGAGTASEISFVSSYKIDLNDDSSGVFNSQKDHEDEVFL